MTCVGLGLSLVQLGAISVEGCQGGWPLFFSTLLFKMCNGLHKQMDEILNNHNNAAD